MKLWGVVIEVNQKDIIVSLPGGMRGFVRTEEVSDIALHGNSKVLIFLYLFVSKVSAIYILPVIMKI